MQLQLNHLKHMPKMHNLNDMHQAIQAQQTN
jgi:hypothetical protein